MLRAIWLALPSHITAKEKMPAVGRVIDREPAFAPLDVDQRAWGFDEIHHHRIPPSTARRVLLIAVASLR